MTGLADGHRYFLDVDADGIRLHVECPHSKNIVNRPCYPGFGTSRSDCSIKDWVDAVDWSEVLHGSFRVELGCEARWPNEGEYLELHITRTPHAWVTTPVDQLELEPQPEAQRTETIDASILNACGPS